MTDADADWEKQVADLWDFFNGHRDPESVEADFLARIDDLAAAYPGSDGVAFFERGSSRDSTGRSDLAVPLYREALARGLTGLRRRRATIQLASSLRNIGDIDESIALLTAERMVVSDDPAVTALDDAVAAALALSLAEVGREREGLSLVLTALAPHLVRYQRSMANYARLLVEPDAE